MDTETATSSKSALEPVERLSEILFGLIMVLTFTGSLSVATADRAEVRTMLIGAIGCNIAWGLIDAIMFLMASLNQRGADIRTIHSIRNAASEAEAHAAIREVLPPIIREELHPGVLERIRHRVLEGPLHHRRPQLTLHDMRGALSVFLIVVASTLPVIVPFMIMHEVDAAMRLSNTIAVVMLALIGFAYGKASGLSPWVTAASMVVIGIILVALTIALGG